MKYETLIEDYHGHSFHNRFEAESDEEAMEIANKDGFNDYGNYDCLWRVSGDYVNHSRFDANEQTKFKQNYSRIM